MKQLKQHFQRILQEGMDKPNRKGEFDQGDSTLSVFGAQLRFSLRDGTLPVTTSKELKLIPMAKEITWMLRGETNVDTLGCGIWDKWALNKDLFLQTLKGELTLINEYIAANQDGKTPAEISKFFFDTLVEHATIAEGTTFTEVNPYDPTHTQEVLLTKELLTVDRLQLPGVSVDHTAVDATLRSLGIEPYNNTKILDKGYCGPIYGKQWRDFESTIMHQGQRQIVTVDQIMQVYHTLRNDVYSRRNIVSAWNPAVITESGYSLTTNIGLGNMGLPPCHYGMQFYVAGQGDDMELSLLLKLRSSDSGVGLPFNIASYAFIAYIFAAEFDLKLGDLVVHIGDAHIYKSHIDGIKEYIARPEHKLPKFNLIEQYETLKHRVCVNAINTYVDQLTYESEEARNAAVDKELIKYYGGGVDKTPEGKEALFKLFIDNIDYTVLTDCIEDYSFEPFIKLDLYD